MWYVGNPDMKPEQCIDADISATWRHEWLTLRGSVFNNWFSDFIYLQPTNETIEGYNVFRYEQSDAILKGFETGLTVEKSETFSISADYSFLSAKRDDGSWLPMIPANRFLIDGKYYLTMLPSAWKNAFVSLGMNYTMEQDNIDMNEFPTPRYWLLNAGAGVTFNNFRILLSCKNLTDQLYYDHLSRLKYYNLYDIGRNIVLNIGWQF
jgi:iron complex outermembrane receptor protein